jgi:hypothetical protein
MRSSLPNASTVKGDLVFDLLFVGDVDDAADQRVIVDRRETDTSMAPVMMTVFPANSTPMRCCSYEAGRPFGRKELLYSRRSVNHWCDANPRRRWARIRITQPGGGCLGRTAHASILRRAHQVPWNLS